MATRMTGRRAAQFRAIQGFRGNPVRGAARGAANAAFARTAGSPAEAQRIVSDALRRGFTQAQVQAALRTGGFNARGARTAAGTTGRQVRAAFRAAGADPGETMA